MQQELTQHGTKDFPMSMDEQRVADGGCQGIRHWHYEVQIVLMTQGSAVFETPVGSCRIHKGQGVFINSGVLHEVILTEDSDSVYICVNFKPELIYGQPESVIRRDYVEPLISGEGMQFFPLADVPWQEEILGLLREMASVNDAQEYGYELALKILLCRIWHLILVNNRAKTEKLTAISFSDKQRMRLLIGYIHQHYMEHITLHDIAQAGHISRGECCKVFRRAEQITPIVYLNRYRISQSIKLLTCTELSICEVAYQSGFESGSYFTECFRKIMNCTPITYRTQYIKNRS
jgi:AraC-like DNA-binding protein